MAGKTGSVGRTDTDEGAPAGGACGLDDPNAPRGPAKEAWGLLFDFAMRLRMHATSVAAAFDLTPMQMFTLKRIEPNQAVPMNALADMLLCDASNVTGIIDKLELRGLIKRRPDERDRRVKMLVLTDKGTKVRQKCLDRMLEPPGAIASLPPADQQRLRDNLKMLLANWAIEDGTAAAG